MHTIRKLARELDRRSVWQVLAGYLLLSWVALRVVEWMTVGVGLPLWTPDMALVLLVIGLPIVTATTVVQEGLPWLRIVDEVDPNELEGRTPEEVHVVPEAHPLHGHDLFTWRNAILGGVMAAALLVTSVVAYLTMWALGIGPVGSLLAQGVVSQDDVIVVADVMAGPLMDESMAPATERALTHVLRADLARSAVVHVVDSTTLRDIVRVLGRTPDEPITPTLALDLAARRGARAVVDAGVTSEGSRYRVSVRLRLADGTQLARFEGSATDAPGLEAEMLRMSARIRERLGEPLRAIHAERRSAGVSPDL